MLAFLVLGWAQAESSAAPVVTSSTANLLITDPGFTINGSGFDPVATNNAVAFSPAGSGTVSNATATTLTVTGLAGLSPGPLNVVVTSNAISSGLPVQVATVVAPPATVTTTAATAVNATFATLNGTLNPNGSSTVATFEYGMTTGYGSSVPVTGGTFTGSITYGAVTTLYTLSPGTTYHYRIKAVNAGGTSYGVDQSFTTPGPPSITGSTASLAANANGMSISGSNFGDYRFISLTFNNGASGTATTSFGSSLQVTFSTRPATAGPLTVQASNEAGSSGAPVQVATVIPVVTASTSAITNSPSSLTINGFGFDTTAASNAVTFSPSGTGTVTSATHTALTVTGITGLVAGNLSAVVTTNAVNSAAPVQVATVSTAAAPVMTTTGATGISTSGVTLNGSANANGSSTVVTFEYGVNTGYGSTVTAAESPVTGAGVTATSAAIASGLSSGTTYHFRIKGVSAGGTSYGLDQFFTTASPPVVTASSVSLPANASGMTIHGASFDGVPANNSVTFNDGAAGTVTAADAGSLTIGFTTKPQTAGPLTVVVTTPNGSSGSPVKVATVVSVVASSVAPLASTATSLIISGTGFDPVAANNSVAFSPAGSGTVTAATTSSLTVTGISGLSLGALDAVVTTNAASSSPVQVATVATIAAPTASTSAATAINATFATLNGSLNPNGSSTDATFEYGTTTGYGQSVAVTGSPFTGSITYGAVTTVFTLSAGTTYHYRIKAVNAGGTTYGVDQTFSTQAVPVITPSTAPLAANAAGMVINGSNFGDYRFVNLFFNNGATGTPVLLLGQALHVNLGTKPQTAGPLTVYATNEAGSSGAPVQVATVTPVVSTSTASIANAATTLTINGFGFDLAAANNSVAFSPSGTGTVTSASHTSLTITGITGLTAGPLTAVVTTNGVGSGAAVQVATVAPVPLSTDASLSALTVSVGTLSPGFSPAIGSYSFSLPKTCVSISVTPTVAEAHATLTINGAPAASGTASGPVTLNAGLNTVTILVTAQDGVTTKTYVLAVRRAGNYAEWAACMGMSGPDAAATADYNGNGLPNLAKWAFGVHPVSPGPKPIDVSGGALNRRGEPVPMLVPNGSGGLDRFAVFGRRSDCVDSGLTYTVEFTADLASWVASTDTPTVLAGDGEIEAVSVPYPAQVNGRAPKFFRVRVTDH